MLHMTIVCDEAVRECDEAVRECDEITCQQCNVDGC